MSDMNTILNSIINVFTVVTILTVVGGGFLLVILAAKSMAEARVIRVGSIALILLILVLTGIGLSDYPAYLMESTIKGLNKASALSPELRAASEDFAISVLGDDAMVIMTGAPDANSGGGFTEPVQFATAAPMATQTAVPTISEPSITPDVVLLVTQNAERVTVMPTATATQTPVPTIDAALWNPQTPAPTPKAGGK
jgi:hypothetical protein